MGMHKNLMTNITSFEVDACAVQNETKRRSFLDRSGKVGLATLAASVLAACSQADAQSSKTAPQLSPPTASADGGQVKPTLVADANDGQMKPMPASVTREELTIEQREVVVALKVVPEARPFIDEMGRFDYAKARTDLGAVEARTLRSDWNSALIEATKRA